MPRKRKGLRAVLTTIEHNPDRSSLFWWLVEHHDEVAAKADGKRLQWSQLCERFQQLGLTDLTGKPAAENTARRTWHRVRRHVAEARARQAAQPPRRLLPSRLPRDWRPPTASMPAVVPVASTAPLPAKSAAVAGQSAGDPSRPRTPEEQRNVDRANAQMDALFAEHDKKFRF